MLTSALENVLFVSALMLGPLTLPVFLLLLVCALFLIVDMVKNREKKSVRIGAGVLAVFILLFAFVLQREGQPYSPGEARRLYESRQTAYDAVALFMLEQAQENGERSYYSNGLREEWPEEIEAELGKVLGSWSLRCGSPDVSAGSRGYSNDLEVLFYIYAGPERDSGDGGTVYDLQYLLYAPNKSRADTANSYTESLTHLTGDWYLYRTVNV